MIARASVMQGAVSGRASVIGTASGAGCGIRSGIRAEAEVIDDVILAKYLRVTPEAEQWLVWLTPQVGVDYTVEANRGLTWQVT